MISKSNSNRFDARISISIRKGNHWRYSVLSCTMFMFHYKRYLCSLKYSMSCRCDVLSSFRRDLRVSAYRRRYSKNSREGSTMYAMYRWIPSISSVVILLWVLTLSSWPPMVEVSLSQGWPFTLFPMSPANGSGIQAAESRDVAIHTSEHWHNHHGTSFSSSHLFFFSHLVECWVEMRYRLLWNSPLFSIILFLYRYAMEVKCL